MLRRSFAHTAHVCHTLSSLGVKPFARSAPVLSKSQLNLKMRDSSAPALGELSYVLQLSVLLSSWYPSCEQHGELSGPLRASKRR